MAYWLNRGKRSLGELSEKALNRWAYSMICSEQLKGLKTGSIRKDVYIFAELREELFKMCAWKKKSKAIH